MIMINEVEDGDDGDSEDGEDGDDGEDDDVGEDSDDGNMAVGTGDNLWYSLSWQSLLSRSGDAHGGECHRAKTINMTFLLHCLKKLKNGFLSFSQTITW